MKLSIEFEDKIYEEDVEQNESSIYKAIGEHLLEAAEYIPTTMYVSCDLGYSEYKLNKRGKFIKDGVEKPSMYVTQVRDSIDGSGVNGYDDFDYPQAYLTCVNPESNNYKFYHLKPSPIGIHATYGRIGASRNEMYGERDLQQPYPRHLYWIRYYEKLSKGYTDQSEIYLGKTIKPKKVAKVDDNDKDEDDGVSANAASIRLHDQLKAFARHVVDETFTQKNITVEQVKAAKKFLNAMGQRKSVKGFNTQLMNLLAVCPRKTRYVNELLAEDESDFVEIMQREENLIAAMEAVAGDTKTSIKKLKMKGFDAKGIEVYDATDKQKAEVLRHLNDSLKGKVKSVYRVINKEHKKRFDAYLKREGIKTVKQLWHGSVNENWYSILVNGLQLNPNARITGKMFGYGIYFAPSSMKSWNYTSYRGTYWANGNSNLGFMGLYATAYGQPHDVHTAGNWSKRRLQDLGKNCVHAHAGIQLRNDEIIFYDEDAVLLNYIVEFI